MSNTTTKSDGGSPFLNHVFYAAGKFVAVGFGRSSANILYSSNGTAWTKATGNPFGSGYGTVKSIITYTAVPTGRLTG